MSTTARPTKPPAYPAGTPESSPAAWALTGDAWLPGVRLLRAEFMKLIRRRGLMTAASVLIAAAALAATGLRGTASSGLILAGAGAAVAAALGVCTGAADITAGVFRGLVTTGRSRVALFLARLPAGLALSVAFTLAGYLVVLAGSALFAARLPAAPGGVALIAGAAFLLGLGLGTLGAGIWRMLSRDA